MSQHIAAFKEWVETLREDVAALRRVVDTEAAAKDARKQAAAALNYLIMRMDLVPDWEPAIGVLDDVFVVRVCARLASQHDQEHFDDKTQVALARLGNQADRIEEFLGAELYGKLRAYCQKLAGEKVRERTPELVLADDNARKKLYAEVDEELQRTTAPAIADADATAVKLRAYLAHKLK
jgi:uncharacterized membrane protein YkvA (DUF1232 family)